MLAILHWMIVATTLLAPCLTHAYVGPGAGLSAIGSVLALVGATLLLKDDMQLDSGLAKQAMEFYESLGRRCLIRAG